MMTRRNLYNFLLVALPLLLLPSIVVPQQSRSETNSRRREELVRQRKEFFAQELELTALEAVKNLVAQNVKPNVAIKEIAKERGLNRQDLYAEFHDL